ncbi:MAG: class I SAM-dependent RNA methyltransferase [Desulfobacteraceae bacterium]|nr:MAG: class I SAM-dependent RNA methyltransferase [Desulfobacteraceae bacterium]
MFKYQETNRYFAQISDGLEDMGALELDELGAKEIQPAYRGIYFEADKRSLYRINYSSRLITRVLAPLLAFKCETEEILYKTAKTIDWSAVFSVKDTFAVFATVSNSKITHSQYAGLRLKDSIADFFRENFGKRPNVDPDNPDVWINLHIENDRATISFDTSGGSLHRRGYRSETIKAPIQETVAAAIIKLTGWDGEKPFYDPMCGSGTLLCEALMHYCRIPSGILRKKFGFQMLPDFDAGIWKSVKDEVSKNMRSIPAGLISGSDISKAAVFRARENIKVLPYGDKIVLKVTDFKKITGLKDCAIVSNPPYGIRMESKDGIENFYKFLGDFLKQQCKGSSAYIYFGNRELIKKTGLKPSWKKPLASGGLDGRFVKYELY